MQPPSTKCTTVSSDCIVAAGSTRVWGPLRQIDQREMIQSNHSAAVATKFKCSLSPISLPSSVFHHIYHLLFSISSIDKEKIGALVARAWRRERPMPPQVPVSNPRSARWEENTPVFWIVHALEMSVSIKVFIPVPSPNRLVVATWASLSKRLRQTKLAWPSPREDFTSFVIMATKAFQRLYWRVETTILENGSEWRGS